jgi:hypothetical protein
MTAQLTPVASDREMFHTNAASMMIGEHAAAMMPAG